MVEDMSKINLFTECLQFFNQFFMNFNYFSFITYISHLFEEIVLN